MQNQLEGFKATVEHRPHREFLFYASFTSDLARRVREHLKLDPKADLRAHFDMFRPQGVGLRAPPQAPKPNFSKYFHGMEIPAGAFINGLGVLETPGSAYHFTHYTSPLRNAQSLKDLEDFPYPSVKGFTEDHLADEVRAIHNRGQVALLSVCHMYENAWQIRGYEPFLMDMMEQPEWCEYILDRITEKNLAVACAAARAGVDYLYTGDDVANQRVLMFSLEQWRKLIKSRWAKVYAAARAIKPDIQVWYHSDGNIESIIPELIEIGVTLLNPVQPECMDPVRIKKLYGDRLVLDGTIGTQTTMPFGTPDDVRHVVRERVETLGKDGALILSPTHVLEPEVPIENILAFAEAARSGI